MSDSEKTPSDLLGDLIFEKVKLKHIILLGILIALIFIARDFNTYSKLSNLALQPTLGVTLLSPTSGETVPAGAMLLVTAQALGTEPIISTELWVNGIPIQNLSAPNEGTNLFTAIFSWIPTQPGEYLVWVRAFDASANSADSDSVVVTIAPTEKTSLAEISLAPYEGYVGPPLGSPPSNPQPSQPWSPSPSDWVTQKSVDEPPIAPQLTASPEDCGAMLTIEDLSDNESGFRVYRQVPSLPGWKLIATLSANHDAAAIAYTDTGYEGLLSYKVSAFNAQDQTESNPIVVDIILGNCPPPEDFEVISIEVAKMLTDENVEQMYCYKSLGGESWSRWPKEGFITPINGQAELINPTIIALLPSQAPGGVEALPPLYMNCWGWMGGELDLLGNMEFENYSGNTQGQMVRAGVGFSIELKEPTFDIKSGAPDLLDMLFKVSLLQPQVSASDNIGLCLDLLSAEANLPYNYCLKGEGSTPWPYDPAYLVWDLSFKDNCALGSNCLDPTDLGSWENVPGVENGEFGYKIKFLDLNFIKTFDTPEQLVMAIPGYFANDDCTDTRAYHLSTYFIPEGSQKMYQSEGQWISAPSPCAKTNLVVLDLILDDLLILHTAEEVDEGDKLELYGIIMLIPQDGAIQVIQLGERGNYPNYISPECLLPEGLSITENMTQFDGRCPTSAWEGAYEFDNLPMCESSGISCKQPFHFGPQRFAFALLDWTAGPSYSQMPQIYINLVDHDENSTDDKVCEGYYTFTKHFPLLAWQYDRTGSFNTENHGSGNCLITFSTTSLYTDFGH